MQPLRMTPVPPAIGAVTNSQILPLLRSRIRKQQKIHAAMPIPGQPRITSRIHQSLVMRRSLKPNTVRGASHRPPLPVPQILHHPAPGHLHHLALIRIGGNHRRHLPRAPRIIAVSISRRNLPRPVANHQRHQIPPRPRLKMRPRSSKHCLPRRVFQLRSQIHRR